MKIILVLFPKKCLLGANGEFRIQNVTSCLTTLGQLQGLFCTMKGAKRDMEIILMFFLKEILFRAIWLFWKKNGMVSSSLWICSQIFLLILLNKRDQEVDKNFISCFLRKNLFWANLIFSGHFLMFHWMQSKLSKATVTIESLKSQDMIKILKQSVGDFSGKRLCGRYCT